jgi:hypothetical protein
MKRDPDSFETPLCVTLTERGQTDIPIDRLIAIVVI